MEFLIGTTQVHLQITEYHVFALFLGLSWALSFLLPRCFSKDAPLKEIDGPTTVLPLNGIPLFGHIIGLLRHGSHYLSALAYVHSNIVINICRTGPRRLTWSSHLNPGLPVAKLRSFGADFYLIQSPDAVQSAYRNQGLDIVPLALGFLGRACGAPTTFTASLTDQANSSTGHDYWHISNKLVRDNLAGGDPLKQMNERILNCVSAKLRNVANQGVGTVSGVYHISNFYQWIWTTMTMANTDAMFGETTNPFRKPEILQKYWTWEQEHLNILYSPMPWLTARKAYNARASVLSALTDFADTIGDDDDNSILTKNCQRLNKEHGVHGGEAAAIYLALVFGATANAFPTLYWMLLHIFRDPGLLRDLRAEVESSAVVPEREEQGPSASGVKVVEASRINATSCPLLLSCYTETLRLVSRHPGARVVTADPATLSFKDARTGEQRSYALKKGSIVHMPAGMLHSSEQHWGPDAAEFDGYRFLRLARHSDRAVDRQARKAHIALGGGKHLCPGRHMALAEILATVAVFVADFELETTAADLPRMVHQFGLGIVKPDEAGDLSVRVRPRNDLQNVTWKFRV